MYWLLTIRCRYSQALALIVFSSTLELCLQSMKVVELLMYLTLDKQTWLCCMIHAVCRSERRVTSASMVRMNADLHCLELQACTASITSW